MSIREYQGYWDTGIYVWFLPHEALLPIFKLAHEEHNPPPVPPIVTFDGEKNLCSWSNFHFVILCGDYDSVMDFVTLCQLLQKFHFGRLEDPRHR